MKSIQRVWTNPILIDETGTILAGHGRLEAAKRLGMTEVPAITLSGLSPSEKRVVVIADNRLPERAVWDFDLDAPTHNGTPPTRDAEVEFSPPTLAELASNKI